MAMVNATAWFYAASALKLHADIMTSTLMLHWPWHVIVTLAFVPALASMFACCQLRGDPHSHCASQTYVVEKLT